MKENVFFIILVIYVIAIARILYILIFKSNKEYAKKLKMIEAMGGGINQNIRGTDVKKKKGVVRIKASEKLKDELSAAGFDMDPGEFVLIWSLFVMVPPFVIYLITLNMILFGVILCVGAVVPPVYVRQKEKKRKEQFGNQLGDALLLVGNCLQSGFSFRKSLDRIVQDMPDPISEEFRQALIRLGYGATMEETLLEIGKRMDNHEMELLTSAVGIHQKAGGKLSDIVENVARTIQERIQLKQIIKTLTAQGRLSGIVVGALPIVMLIFITLMNPSYTAVFFNTLIGNIMLVIVGIMELLGMFVISKIIKIDI